MQGKLILLTGAPGTGKSTLAMSLEQCISGLKCFDYGTLLINAKKKKRELSYEQLRSESSNVITHSDVHAVDQELVNAVTEMRLQHHCLIVSHAVTREAYGYRAIPFSSKQLEFLRFDAVLALHMRPERLAKRVQELPEGRLPIDPYIAMQHQFLQDAFAATYCVLSHCRYYGIDANSVPADTLKSTLAILSKEGIQ